MSYNNKSISIAVLIRGPAIGTNEAAPEINSSALSSICPLSNLSHAYEMPNQRETRGINLPPTFATLFMPFKAFVP